MKSRIRHYRGNRNKRRRRLRRVRCTVTLREGDHSSYAFATLLAGVLTLPNGTRVLPKTFGCSVTEIRTLSEAERLFGEPYKGIIQCPR